MAEAEQKGRQETRDRLGEVVNRPKADHPDDHGSTRIDVGDVRHPEVRDGNRQHDQTDVRISEQSDEELFAWINENPGKFDGVIERRIELEAREIMRNLDKD